MKNSAPTLDDWKPLYEAAKAFKALKPWEWMYDSDLFGVEDPAGGETGYCCIMGALGEVYAMGVYLGGEGLDAYSRMHAGEVNPMDMMHVQKCLMASLEDRDHLEKPDLKVIRDLGLRFRGRKAWPMFRSYEPGYYPWFLDGRQVGFLAVALEQALQVARRMKKDPDLLTPPRQGEILVRGNSGGKWEDRWVRPEPWEPPEPRVTGAVDEIRLRKIKNSGVALQGVWELDVFYAPTPVRESKDERPYFPYTTLCVDGETGMILHSELYPPRQHAEKFRGSFLDFLENAQGLPREIRVVRRELEEQLGPFAAALGFRGKAVQHLEALEEARMSLFEFFASRG